MQEAARSGLSVPIDGVDAILLLAAVLRRAMRDFALYRGHSRGRKAPYWRDADLWLFRRKRDHYYEDPDDAYMSVHNICFILGYSVERARTRALAMTREEALQD